jgi:hypothetical protein
LKFCCFKSNVLFFLLNLKLVVKLVLLLLLLYLISGSKKKDLQIEGKFKDILRTFEAQFVYNLRTPRLRLILLVLIKQKECKQGQNSKRVKRTIDIVSALCAIRDRGIDKIWHFD